MEHDSNQCKLLTSCCSIDNFSNNRQKILLVARVPMGSRLLLPWSPLGVDLVRALVGAWRKEERGRGREG